MVEVRSRKTILVLEDDPCLLKLLQTILKEFVVLQASRAAEAIEHFNVNPRKVDLLVADVTLPESSGVRVALILRGMNPALPVILTSGYPAINWIKQDSADFASLGSQSVLILEKPFPVQKLLGCVCELIGPAMYEKVRTA